MAAAMRPSVRPWLQSASLVSAAPQGAPTKQLVSVRYSPEVLAFFKAGGAGWQSRMDDVLKEWVSSHGKTQAPHHGGQAAVAGSAIFKAISSAAISSTTSTGLVR